MWSILSKVALHPQKMLKSPQECVDGETFEDSKNESKENSVVYQRSFKPLPVTDLMLIL